MEDKPRRLVKNVPAKRSEIGTSRCIGEAIAATEKNGEKWFEAEVYRTAGKIALNSPQPDAAKAEEYFERALGVARRQGGKILGTARRDEHGAALARSG